MDQKPWWMRFFWRYVDFETKRVIILQRERINSLERIIKLQRKSIDVLEITVRKSDVTKGKMMNKKKRKLPTEIPTPEGWKLTVDSVGAYMLNTPKNKTVFYGSLVGVAKYMTSYGISEIDAVDMRKFITEYTYWAEKFYNALLINCV